jgi:acetyltransferase-like isoleucine patch superfamily enzyme
MSIADKIKANPKLKGLAHSLLIPPNDHRPRLWVRWFLMPFLYKKGKNTVIRRNVRLDIFPFNKFSIGTKSIIESFSTINNGVGNVSIGDHTIVGIGSVVIGPVTIGNQVMLAQNIVISGLNHGYENVDISPAFQKVTTGAIIIEDDVWIGANSIITAGVTIGKHSIIGGGSVVTKDVPPYTVAVGNPAKIIKQYNFEEKLWKRV